MVPGLLVWGSSYMIMQKIFSDDLVWAAPSLPLYCRDSFQLNSNLICIQSLLSSTGVVNELSPLHSMFCFCFSKALFAAIGVNGFKMFQLKIYSSLGFGRCQINWNNILWLVTVVILSAFQTVLYLWSLLIEQRLLKQSLVNFKTEWERLMLWNFSNFRFFNDFSLRIILD